MRAALLGSCSWCASQALTSPALADVFAVAEPETQTVAINGGAAEFEGSGSCAEDPPCPVAIWAWDFGTVSP